MLDVQMHVTQGMPTIMLAIMLSCLHVCAGHLLGVG